MRTLLISDLHLGLGPRHAVLEWPAPRARLLDALGDIDRLVLLGDTVELLQAASVVSLPKAEPLLSAIGDRLGARGEVIIVPGNHDRPLVARWLRGRGAPLAPDTEVPLDASPALARMAQWLGPARVRAHYPGVSLPGGIWATHGHYLDRHLLPDSSYGVARGLLGRLPSDGALPDDYERAGGPSVSALQARVPPTLRGPLREALDLARRATMPSSHRRLLHPRLAPIARAALGQQVRRASLPALARVVHRLGVRADAVVFGHVHRLGPLPTDDPRDWQDPTGTVRLFNTGSWVYEPLLVHRRSPPHPYWPGGAILVADGESPRPVGLLDALDAADMHRPLRAGR